MIFPLGAAAFVVFYLVFRVMITKLDLKTPGREEDVPDAASGGQNRDRAASSGSSAGSGAAAAGAGEDRGGTDANAGTGRPAGGSDAAKAPIIVDGFNINGLMEGLGGKSNVQSFDNCITRLRVEVRNIDAVDMELLKASGAKAVIKTGAESLQVVIGMKVQSVADAMRKEFGI